MVVLLLLLISGVPRKSLEINAKRRKSSVFHMLEDIENHRKRPKGYVNDFMIYIINFQYKNKQIMSSVPTKQNTK